MKRWMETSNLDEMQELMLLHVERCGCWLAFWGLFVSLVAQSFLYSEIDFRTIGAEWIVFMALALYLVIACARRGIFDRRLRMTQATYLGGAAIAGGFAAACSFSRSPAVSRKNPSAQSQPL